MPQEIERKFLVISEEYKLKAYSHSHIVQGYICRTSGKTVRIRIRNGKGYLTIKGASDAAGISRYEWEHELSITEAQELMQLCDPGVIDKTRYLVRYGTHTFEVDEFDGANAGLVIAEVELQSENEPFEIPNFIGREVTGDRRYYNAQLTIHPYSEWHIP
ncbi:MAG: CYTH domain-containing protein [Prevotellaceae bacterium]|jgi:CYTH domain-containing protein|nr:CYTH domain-containing protein [Prevotellaceae bacterium]